MTPRMRRSILGLFVIVLISIGLLWPVMKSSNCGGNSAALAACNGYVSILRSWGAENNGQRFYYSLADSKMRDELKDLPGASWIRSGRLLIKVEDVCVDPMAKKRVIMVCDRAYDNVPERFFGTAPMAHAVAYSTGETGLISPEEFARLDLSGFIDLRRLAKTMNSETNKASSAADSRYEADKPKEN
jgi:hypothetical protein